MCWKSFHKEPVQIGFALETWLQGDEAWWVDDQFSNQLLIILIQTTLIESSSILLQENQEGFFSPGHPYLQIIKILL